MTKMDEYLAALEDWFEARTDYQKCVEKCDASSGYFLAGSSSDLRDATDRLRIAFKGAVREAMQEKQE